MLDIGIMAAPSASNLVLNSSGGNNYSNENLTAYWDASDGDSDPIKNITNWLLNGNPIAVLNMPFENNTGNVSATTKDYSGLGNNGTIISATWNSTGGYDSWGAYQFDGSDDYINVGTGSELNLTGAMSVEAWIKPLDMNNYQAIVIKFGGSGSPAVYQYIYAINNVDNLSYYNPNSGWIDLG